MDRVADLLARKVQFIRALQVHPERTRHTEILTEPQRSISGDVPFSRQKLIEAAGRHFNKVRQSLRRQAGFFQLVAEDFSGVHGCARHWCSFLASFSIIINNLFGQTKPAIHVKVISTAPMPDFTPHERFLIEKTEIAIEDGLQLEHWRRDPNRKIDLHEVNLNRPYKLQNKAWGYFADVTINNQELTALGCLQEVEFGKIDAPNPEELLKDFVLSHFLNSAHWMYPDGHPGGFTFEQLLYRTTDGTYGRYSPEEKPVIRDWTEIGTKYQWSLFTVFLHDFVLKLGPVTKHLREAASLVQHPDFIHIGTNPKPGYKYEVAFGYPFIDFAPIPNNFGFGPGKFNWAIKTFSFLLRDNNEVRCDMDFVAGARPKKVFDFGQGIPCPLYGTSDALEKLTFGLKKSQPFHDFMDLNMATQHGRVHQALMEGSAKVFAEWLAKSRA